MGLDVGRGHRLTRSVDTHDQLWTKSRLRRIELDVDHSRNLTDPRFESCSFPAVGSNAAPVVCERETETVNTFRLILHPTCVIKPSVDGCPLVAANSMEIEKVRSFFMQIRQKDHAAALGGIVRVILRRFPMF